MKFILLLAPALVFTGMVNAQTLPNTFPATGNVGIGTTSPIAPLQINGTANDLLSIVASGTGRGGIMVQNTNAGSQATMYTTNDLPSFGSYCGFLAGGSANGLAGLFGLSRANRGFMIADGASNLGLGVGTLTAQPLVLGTNNAERMRVSATGNVGIGTTSPVYPLDVNGNVRIGSATSAASYLMMNSSLSSNFSMTTGGSTDNAFGIYTNGGNNGSNYCQFGNNQASIYLDTRGGIAPYRFFIGSTDDMDIFASGNIGIATANTDGGYRLDVNGTTRLRAGVALAGLTTDNTKTKVVVGDASGNLFFRDATTLGGSGAAGWALTGNTTVNPSTTFIGTTDNTPVAFRTNNLEHMRIDGVTGNVGIGTTAPQSMLAVEGTITSQKVVVTQTGWADYVFQPSYQLLPLKDLDKFIRANRHLPELPSAEEVKKQGDDLGSNQVALLKKVEELTLYIIEQDKRAQQQDQKLQNQDQQLQEQGRQLREQQERIDRLEQLIR